MDSSLGEGKKKRRSKRGKVGGEEKKWPGPKINLRTENESSRWAGNANIYGLERGVGGREGHDWELLPN